VPAIPEAAYRASISVWGRAPRTTGTGPRPVIGVSGGGGEPLWALVVEVEAVELMRLMEEGSRMFNLLNASAVEPADGGGQY